MRHRCTVPRDKEEWNAAQAKTAERERRGNVGACGGRSEQITGTERRKACEWSGDRAVNAATCTSRINRTPSFLPLLLDRLFSVEENKSPRHPILETKEKETHGCRTKVGFIPAYYFVFVRRRGVFLIVGPKQSNQIAFLSDASQCSHSARTMAEFISFRQQCCQCNL